MCKPASQPSLPVYVYHVIDILGFEILTRSPRKSQLTHLCLTHLIHPETPPILLNCHQEYPGLQKAVRNCISCREWVGTSQSHLGDDLTNHHWQQGQDSTHMTPLDSEISSRPIFATPILEQLVHRPQGQSCPKDEQELRCPAAETELVSR